MLTITETLPFFETYHAVLDYDPTDSLFFDIETTGLSAASSIVFLIGTVFYDGKNWQLRQFLAENSEDEAQLLKEFFTLAENYSTVIHFNGATFDLPYVKERARYHLQSQRILQENVCVSEQVPSKEKVCINRQIPAPKQKLSEDLLRSFEQKISLDLYQKFRPLKKLLRLERMNQTSLETFFKWPRKDQLTGKHMISLFKKFEASRETLIANLLLLHNHDDLLGMTQILKLASYQMLFGGNISNVSAELLNGIELSLPDKDANQNEDRHSAATNAPAAFPEGTAASIHNSLLLHFQLEHPLPVSLHLIFAEKYPTCTISLNIQGDYGQLLIPCFCGELKYFFPDYRNYYYLPMEDQAIHKSVGAFVDKEHRQNARPGNCCTKKYGIFLPQPKADIEPVFRKEFKSKELFFEYQDTLLTDSEFLLSYTRMTLANLCPL